MKWVPGKIKKPTCCNLTNHPIKITITDGVPNSGLGQYAALKHVQFYRCHGIQVLCISTSERMLAHGQKRSKTFENELKSTFFSFSKNIYIIHMHCSCRKSTKTTKFLDKIYFIVQTGCT